LQKEDLFDVANQIVTPLITEINQYSTDSIERAILRLIIEAYNLKFDKLDDSPIVNQIWNKISNNLRCYGAITLYLISRKLNKLIWEVTESEILENYDNLDLIQIRLDLESYITSRKKNIEGVDKKWLKYVIVATGNIYEDGKQARIAVQQGADCIAVIRTTAQSLLDFVPEGLSTEGFGGTFATLDNFKYMRKEIDDEANKLGRKVYLVNYASGMCMPEITVCAIQANLDMLLNDSMYGILFRDINPLRTFTDQFFSRKLCALSNIIINTGEDNYLTTSDAIEKAWSVTASQCINYCFAKHAGMNDNQLGIGHAFEIDPNTENALSYEIAHAMLTKILFPNSPVKYMPPTRFKCGDIFFSQSLDTLFNLVSSITQQNIHLLGMNTEAIHTPFLQDRYNAINCANYVHTVSKDLMSNFTLKEDSFIITRIKTVMEETLLQLNNIQNIGLYEALEQGIFADISRTKFGGKGFSGVIKKNTYYTNFM
jgi:D-Lysine 5,6-aminomutase alpha subunit.